MSEPEPSARRLWFFRGLALVGIPALLFAALEVGLRVGGYGQSTQFLIPDAKPGYYRTNPEFVSSFLPSSFDLRPLNYRVALHKPNNSLRVVILGESAAQGIPVPAFGFVAQLRAQLRARYPGREVEVINTGIVAINSHVVYQIAKQLASFSPDIVVVYMGNNEVVGPYGPGCTYLPSMPPLPVIRLSVLVRSTRVGQLLLAALSRLRPHAASPKEWGGMSMFVDSSVRGDDPRLEKVYANFEANLRDIVSLAGKAGAKTILCTPVSNLKDCAPFLSLNRTDLQGQEKADWDLAFRRGRLKWVLGEYESARTDLKRSLQLDPTYAEASYLLGSIELTEGDTQAARGHLIDAEHWDALRFRPDPRICEAIRAVAASAGPSVTLLDSARLMGSDPLSTTDPAGREALFEHVHFDWSGAYGLSGLIARSIDQAAGAGSGAWLDEAGCARAVGYSLYQRLTVLEKIGAILQNPPFTGQVTYPEDEARLAHEISRAQAARTRASADEEAVALNSAITADPENADLVKLDEDLSDDRDLLDKALDDARRAEALEPENFALVTDEAIKLQRLGRAAEAEPILKAAAARAPERDRALMAPAFADLFTRTGRFEEGYAYFAREIAADPANASLEVNLARLAKFGSDTPRAEAAYKAALAVDPANQPALEGLVRLYEAGAQRDKVEQTTLQAAPLQPRNLSNNLRAAILSDSKGDTENAIRYLEAAESSGPIGAAVELRLARTLYSLGKTDQALAHLSEAWRISIYEGDPTATQKIRQMIDTVRSRAG